MSIIGGSQKRRSRQDAAKARGPKALVLYADSEKDGDMMYATRVVVPDPFLFFRWRGRKYIVIGDLEFSRVRREAKVDRVFSFRDLARATSKKVGGPLPVAEICSCAFESMGIHRIEVPRSFPLGLADDLRNMGFQVESRDDPFFSERAIKDRPEIDHIRHALRAAEYGMEVAVGALREARIQRGTGGQLALGVEPLSSGRLRAIIHKAILEMNCYAKNTIVACGRQSYDPHERGSGALRAHEAIIVDIFPRCEVSGYYGDLSRTFVKGEASPKIREMFAAVKKAQQYAIRKIHPGVQSCRIHSGIVKMFEEYGFPKIEESGSTSGFIHGTGHGLGLDLHEHPRIGTSPTRLRAGNVVTVEPGLYYPDVGGVRLEDVVWIEKRGARNLTRFPKFLEI